MKKLIEMARALRSSEAITVSPAVSATEIADGIWQSLEDPSLGGAVAVLEDLRLETRLRGQVLVLLTRKSTSQMMERAEASRFNSSEVVRGVNKALEAQEEWPEFDWGKKEVA